MNGDYKSILFLVTIKYMDLITPPFRLLSENRYRQLDSYKDQAKLIQATQLRQVTQVLCETEYGRTLGIHESIVRDQYEKFVPIVTYEDIAPLIDRMVAGEKNILTNERTEWFAKSSGTTNAKSKYIPINRTHLQGCHFKGGMDSVRIYLRNNPDSSFFSHKGFALAGTYDPKREGTYTRTGDLSATLLMQMPRIGRAIRVPNINTSLIADWEQKREAISNEILTQDVGNISGVPSWMLLILKEVLRKTGASNIREVWPNLEVFFHGGIAFGPYREEYKRILGEGVRYQENYNASEGFFGIQDDPSDSSMLLMIDYGVYYEFIPMDDFDETNPSGAIPLHEVEVGKNYALVISTLGGLYRYLIGDTVCFTQKNPYKFIITGRTKSFINAFGEELMVANADEAFAKVGIEMNCRVREYTAGPVFLTEEGKGLHHWVVEWEIEPRDTGLFVQKFDDALKASNSDYEAKRYKDFSLQLPKVSTVPSGTFYEWMKQRGKLGGQNKVPRLTKDDKMVNQVLDIAKELRNAGN